jgi:hypothetical protein
MGEHLVLGVWWRERVETYARTAGLDAKMKNLTVPCGVKEEEEEEPYLL